LGGEEEKMSAIVSGFAPKGKKCSDCDKELIDRRKNLCPQCQEKRRREKDAKRRLGQTQESKTLRKIEKTVDQERIDRLEERIKNYNLQYHIEAYVSSAMDKNPNDPQAAQKQALEETKSWTFEDIQNKLRSDYEVMAEILTRYNIVEEIEGDMAPTWHIAFNRCGYKQYEVDDDGLPLKRPGILNFSQMRYMRKRSDTHYTGRDGRLGIVSVPFRETPRRRYLEHRIILCQKEQVYDLLDSRRRVRHSRENDSMARLRLAMQRTVSEKQSIIDQLVGIINRT
jgi:hypothetical protein